MVNELFRGRTTMEQDERTVPSRPPRPRPTEEKMFSELLTVRNDTGKSKSGRKTTNYETAESEQHFFTIAQMFEPIIYSAWCKVLDPFEDESDRRTCT